MIRINQIKIIHDENKSYDYDTINDVLKAKVAKILRVSVDDMESFEIIRHSIDARKKPEIYHIYIVDVSLKNNSEEGVVKKCRNKDVSIIEPVRYAFPLEEA